MKPIQLLTTKLIFLGGAMLPVQGATVFSFDFGTDAGKVTLGDAGFLHNPVGITVVSHNANNAEIETNKTVGGAISTALLRTFTGLGQASTNDFSVTSTITLDPLSENATVSRFGFLMFGQENATDRALTGVFAGIQRGTSADLNQPLVHFRTSGSGGVNGDVFHAANISPVEGETFHYTVAGTYGSYSGGNNLRLDFSVVRESDSQTFSPADPLFVNTTSFAADANLFGFVGRFGGNPNDSTIFLDDFQLTVIPESATTFMLLGGCAALLLRRNRYLGLRALDRSE